MSLIPSESYSFPDHFTQTISHSRNPRRKTSPPEGEPETLPQEIPPSATVTRESPQKHPPTAGPEPAKREAALPPAPRPELPRRKSLVPARLKPKLRWNSRAVTPEPNPALINGDLQNGAMNVVSEKTGATKLARPARPGPVPQAPVSAAEIMQALATRSASRLEYEVQVDAPQPIAPAVETPSHETQMDMFALEPAPYLEKKRRRSKFARFIMCEAVTLAVLLPLAILGLCRVFSDPTLVLLVNILTIAAAVTAALIPILFFAVTPTLPRDGSMNRL